MDTYVIGFDSDDGEAHAEALRGVGFESVWARDGRVGGEIDAESATQARATGQAALPVTIGPIQVERAE